MQEHDLNGLLHRRPTPASPVLTVYLDIDQARQHNRNQAYVTALRGLLRELEESVEPGASLDALRQDARLALEMVAAHRPRGRTLVVCCDASQGFSWSQELQVRLDNHATWGPTPQVRPLLEALDEYERYAVVLADRSRARLFTVFMGEIHEREDAVATGDVRHIKASGTDHLWSEAGSQRRADGHAREHLRRVAEMTDRLEREHGFDRLVLAGPTEAMGELQRLLSRRLQGRLATSIALPVEAAAEQVLAATVKVEEEIERRAEEKIVDELLEAAGRERATLGVGPTLDALPAGRVLQLVYSSTANGPAAECPECQALYAGDASSCPRCRAHLQPINDLLSRLAELTLELGGRVEQVRGAAAERLESKAEGMGAFLRY